MNIPNLLLDEVSKLFSNQEVMSRIINEELLSELGVNEIHCIDAIGGTICKPNGISIAQHMGSLEVQ